MEPTVNTPIDPPPDAGALLSAWSRDAKLELSAQERLLALRTMPLDRSSRTKLAPHLRAAADALDRAEAAQAAVRSYLRAERARTQRAAQLRARALRQAARIALIRERLPPNLVEALDRALATPVAAAKEDVGHVDVKETADETPQYDEEQFEEELQEEPCEYPQIRRVTKRVLDECPQYVRGRLTAERIAGVVEKINAFICIKYELLARPAKQVRGAERDRRIAMRATAQEAAVADTTFVTDFELKSYTDFKLDATARSTINVLRHIGALKEVRIKNKVRAFIVR